MNTYISILRGINLGNHNKIKMDALKEIFIGLGCENIQTYIQSGNVVYQSRSADINELNSAIQKALEKSSGFNVPIITLTATELKKVTELNPFLKEGKDASFFHVTFLNAMPSTENLEKIANGDYGQDEFRVIEKAVYLYCPNGYKDTKLSNNFFERKLKVTATTRNWKTVNMLLTLADQQIES